MSVKVADNYVQIIASGTMCTLIVLLKEDAVKFMVPGFEFNYIVAEVDPRDLDSLSLADFNYDQCLYSLWIKKVRNVLSKFTA